jgi:hypothetical protein
LATKRNSLSRSHCASDHITTITAPLREPQLDAKPGSFAIVIATAHVVAFEPRCIFQFAAFALTDRTTVSISEYQPFAVSERNSVVCSHHGPVHERTVDLALNKPELFPECSALDSALASPLFLTLKSRCLQLAPAIACAVSAAFAMAELTSHCVSYYVAIACADDATGYALAIASADADAKFYAYPCALRIAVAVAHARAH